MYTKSYWLYFCNPACLQLQTYSSVSQGISLSFVLKVVKVIHIVVSYCHVRTVKFHVLVLIGANLSEPHIDHDNGPRTRNNGMYLSMYLCIIYPVFVTPWFLCTP